MVEEIAEALVGLAAQSSLVYLAETNGYELADGTSFASPMVTAVACHMLQVNKDLTPFEVREILLKTASHAMNPDTLLGWGIIDVDAAAREAKARTTSTEELPAPDTGQIIVTGAFPNPLARTTSIELQASVPVTGVRLELFNVLGQQVAVLFEGTLQPGTKTGTLDGAHLPTGGYFYVLSSATVRQSGAVILVR